jgi:CBS domain-containing protein
MRRTIPVKEVMTKEVVTVSPKDTIAKAAKLMSSHRVGCLVVIQDGSPIGVITERDILTKVVGLDLKPSKVLVGEVMSSPPITIGPEVSVTEAARLMKKHEIRRLPVVNEGKLVGIVTASDLASVIPEMAEFADFPVPSAEEVGTSVCEVCGQFTTHLYEVNGKWVCESCKDSME